MPTQPLRIEVIDDSMAEVLRSKTPAERLAVAHGMWRHASKLVRQSVKTEHPEWSQNQLNDDYLRRVCGEEVLCMIKESRK